MWLWLILACSPAVTPVNIELSARAGGQEVRCGEPATLADERALIVTDLRFFLHDLVLIDADGDEWPILLADSDWQRGGITLVDLEDGCHNGTPPTHSRIEGQIQGPAAHLTALGFTLGVPFAENHANPALARGPLSTTSMHWSWQGGYKFLRVDYSLDGQAARVHLGSTGCQGTIGDISSCDRPNRPTARLDLPEQADLGALSLQLSLDEFLVEGQGCMGEATEPGCGPVFKALGLDPVTGQPDASASVFQLR